MDVGVAMALPCNKAPFGALSSAFIVCKKVCAKYKTQYKGLAADYPIL